MKGKNVPSRELDCQMAEWSFRWYREVAATHRSGSKNSLTGPNFASWLLAFVYICELKIEWSVDQLKKIIKEINGGGSHT